jgi:phage regulator Rha-like protein
MQKLDAEEPIIYKGIDWLRIGYYLESNDKSEYITLLETLKDILRNKEFEERFFEIPQIDPFTGEQKENLRFRVKTTANIYPYIVILVFEPLGLSIRLGRPLRDTEIEDLYESKPPTPNLMLELTGKSLRPQMLPLTIQILQSFFLFLNELETYPVALTFSRIDYALDFRDKTNAIDLLLEFEKMRKITIQTDEEKITYAKTVKKFKEEILKLSKFAKHIGVGDPRRLLIVYYHKTDADKYLQEIYFAHNFIYGLDYPHRVEARFNTDYFKGKRKIYFLEKLDQAWNLENLIREATEIALNHLPEKFKEYAQLPLFLFPEPNQLWHRRNADEILPQTEKIVRKLTLQEEALRFLSQLIRIKEEWNTTADELLLTLKEMIEHKHIRIIKKAKEKNIAPKEFLELLPSLYK